jgi:hypothetical protein
VKRFTELASLPVRRTVRIDTGALQAFANFGAQVTFVREEVTIVTIKSGKIKRHKTSNQDEQERRQA